MSCHMIYYKDGAKMMMPVLTKEEYIAIRNGGEQRERVKRIRSGEESLKHKLVQMNYSCLPNEDGTLKGSTRMSNTVGMDIDHIPAEEMQAVKERILSKKEELGLLMLEESARGEGLHLVFKRRADLDQEGNLKWASELLGVAYDAQAKDITRVFFTTTGSQLIFLSEELFRPVSSEETTEFKIQNSNFKKEENNSQFSTLPLRSRDSLATPSAFNSQLKEDSQLTTDSKLSTLNSELTFRGIKYSEIIESWWKQNGGEPQEGERNVKLYQLAVNLRAICDNKKEVLLQIMPRLGLDEQEFRSIIDSACKEPPKGISKQLQAAIDGNEELRVKNEESAVPPEMPTRLPKLIQLLTSRTPAIYKAAVAHAVFPALATHLWRTRFRYIDNKLHEATLMNCLMAGTGAGKDCISEPIDHIMADIRRNDAENMKREKEWKDEINAKGANKDKRKRPEGLVIQEIDADMTNPAFVMRMAEADEHFLYVKLNEIDQFDALKGNGSGGQQFRIMCLAFDPNNRYGQTRIGTQSVTERVCIRFNWNATTTIQKGQKYFSRVLTDGPLSRINFCTIPEREIGSEIPVYGEYDSNFDDELRPYIERLCAARGEIDCPQAFKLAKKLNEECADFSRLSQSRTYENFTFRANVIAYLKACVLFVANDYKWDKSCEDFIRWSLNYDLWCKMQFFGDAIEQVNNTSNRTGTRGPRNLLELLPDTFTIEDAKKVRRLQGLNTQNTLKMVRNWKSRNYVTQISDISFQKAKTNVSVNS